ncbi:probable cytochrome P450 313a4 [Chironomus tepperi]|uniref:probable cytochrome P450 313a4 n=1 Tax=Chironomus tepperi TaxID=113505 RepID=UPI00391F804A
MFVLETLVLFLLVTIVTYYVVFRWKRQRLYELADKLPGHDGFTLWESIYMTLTVHRKDYIPIVLSYIKDEAPLTKLWLLKHLLVMTKDANVINKIFNSPYTVDKPELFYDAFLVKRGLIAINGDDQKVHRKIFTKSFTPKVLQTFPVIFDEKAKQIMDMLNSHVNCGEFEFMDYAGSYSFDALGTTNLNYDGKSFFKSDMYHAFEKFSPVMVDILPYLVLGFTRKQLRYFPIGKRIDEIFNVFDKYMYDIIDNNHKHPCQDEHKLINVLMDPKNKFDDDDIRDEFITMMIGAFETSTKIISSALMMLGIHKNVQEKLINEINEIYSQELDTPTITVDFLNKFQYLEAVIKETMRLFTVAPILSRQASQDVEIDGYLIPKGTAFLLSIDAMHKDEKYWGQDAHLFRPERFLETLLYPHAYAPFSGGRRMCIGYRYAMLSMKVFIINFLKTYKVNCSTKFDELETEMTMTLNFVKGYKVSIEQSNK